MTAITPAYAHAYQSICRPISEISSACCQSQISASPQCCVPQHAKEAMVFRVGPPTLTGALALLMVKHKPGWGAVARSLRRKDRCHVWPSYHDRSSYLAFAGARVHSSNTAKMSAIVEALSFLGPHGPVACDACSCVFFDSKHAAGVCLSTILARTHVQLGLSCQQLLLKSPAQASFYTCNTSTVTRRILETNARIMLLRWVLLAWCRTISFPHVERVTPLNSASCFATCLRPWRCFSKNYVTLEWSMFLPLGTRPGVSVLFHTVLQGGVSCLLPRSFAWLKHLQLLV